MALRIMRADWEEWHTDLLRIRYRVFVDEQGVPQELEHDTHDPTALHLLAWSADQEAVATARLLTDGQIGRLAVLPAWRRQGIGGALLSELIRIAGARGRGSVFLHAQYAAESFYRRFGFVTAGEVFEEAGIQHRRMQLSLAADAQHDP